MRQLVMPMLDGGRLVGVLLVADAAQPYDDDDRRHVEHIADAAAKLLRRRRSDAEIVTAMDHMERVMFGAIGRSLRISKSLPGNWPIFSSHDWKPNRAIKATMVAATSAIAVCTRRRGSARSMSSAKQHLPPGNL